MKSRMKAVKKTSLSFPKLMVNEHVVALFANEDDAMVVHRISANAIPIGDMLSTGTFDIDNFEDYEGIIELSNN